MSIGPQIRRANTADVKCLSVLGRAVFQESFGNNIAAIYRQSFSLEEQLQEILDPASIFFILELDEKACGYARLLESEAPASVTGEHPVELAQFYLLQQWTGKGLGNQLMYRCLEEAFECGYDVIWLAVGEHNQRAIDFFTRWGYRTVETQISRLCEKKQQIFVMQRPLE